ncbi:MAG: MBL fold metallo-hydrolase [Myxococcota bacterium]|nr:MBL fold metallo-hydrolase [Myxococcota bacterium]
MTFRWTALGLVLAALVWSCQQRRQLVVELAGLREPPGLLEPADEGPGVRWVDDYFTVQRLDARTFAIGEPRYAQQNYSYLIAGSERALLFDAGPGLRDIRAVAESLTDRPITLVPSHLHFDHVGDVASFERVAVVDLPYLRDRAPDGRLRLTRAEHLGFVEDIATPTLTVTEWLAPGSVVSLGDRDLRVLHTPGHTTDSISLLDLSTGWLFSGDFVYPGPLFAFLPNSHLGEYLRGAQAVLAAVDAGARVLGAHRDRPPGLPELGRSDVEDLRATLERIRAGEARGNGVYPVTYPVNDRITLLAEPRWLQRW